MQRISKITTAIVSLFASGALLAQSMPPKPKPKPGKITVAQAQPAALLQSCFLGRCNHRRRLQQLLEQQTLVSPDREWRI